ncbi:hypothetical protein EVAR_49455_1 [Eumeta japonica]|uniref:Uncharacterized protein n=1 Tax=Eumeta variegata TaxID=151549 RepID=A0A4C1Y627_EUMVA|nr:hypothetical protein EVAR_49455_1 [Eumeta japonica]
MRASERHASLPLGHGVLKCCRIWNDRAGRFNFISGAPQESSSPIRGAFTISRIKKRPSRSNEPVIKKPFYDVCTRSGPSDVSNRFMDAPLNVGRHTSNVFTHGRVTATPRDLSVVGDPRISGRLDLALGANVSQRMRRTGLGSFLVEDLKEVCARAVAFVRGPFPMRPMRQCAAWALVLLGATVAGADGVTLNKGR